MSDTANIFGIDGWEVVKMEDPHTGTLLKHCEHPQLGRVNLSDEALSRSERDDENTYKILGLLWENHLRGERVVLFDGEEAAQKYREKVDVDIPVFTLEEFLRKFPKNIVEKQRRILMNIYGQYPTPGELMEYFPFEPWQYYASGEDEMVFLLECMKTKGWLDIEIDSTLGGDRSLITDPKLGEDGWVEIEKSLEPLHSNQVFVAMWFDDTMNPASDAIDGAITDTGFKPLRIDRKPHNNEISGEILYEISRSRFVIADVTEQRQGVYFEAGYAMGLGIPVIWSCKKEEIDDVHFDTRQYSHVVWEDEEQLYQMMVDRIKGTILARESGAGTG
jgi:nucleoside 2-deoxyribosyltransferase